MKLHLLLFLIIFSLCSLAQKYTISGYVTDLKTGEKLIGASVYDAESMKGTITNNYGFFSLTLPASKVKFTVSFIGYNSFVKEFDLKENIVINVDIDPTLLLQEVVVVESRSEKKVKSTEMSVMEMPIKDIKTLPVLLGEVDVLKAIQLMPGVQSGNEGTSGFYVRGGGPDQNLILLDGVPVYNADHLFGFFSVFNADAISSVKLIKGGFPARYGGRLSSVLDIRMKEGNKKEFHVEGSVGIISSKLTVEGPIIKDKTSFIVSGRRTYLDLLLRPLIKAAYSSEDPDATAGYYFYDLNGKINHKFSDRSHLYLSVYNGQDKAYFRLNDEHTEDDVKYEYSNNSKLQWGNTTTAARWNYELNKKLFSNTTLTYSKYKFLIGDEMTFKTIEGGSTKKDLYSMEYSSGIDDIAGRIDFEFIPDPDNYIRFGVSQIYHTFNPGINAIQMSIGDGVSEIDTSIGNSKIYANEFQAYIEDDLRITGLLKANVGLHYSGFYVNNTYYQSLQPRASARYMFTEKFSLKAAYSRMNQYILLLSNSGIGLPTDLWLPVTDSIKPQNSTQYVIGGVYALKKNLDISIECFYKKMNNIIEYKEGATFFSSASSWESKVEMGQGWSYGAEFLIHKHIGKLTGWVGYTYAKTERQFDNISFGEKFPYRYDRRHDISITCSYEINDEIDISGVWVFGTGNAVTLGLEKYSTAYDLTNPYWYSEPVEYFESRNNYRMPSYHRMDLGVNFKKVKKWGVRTWSVGVYNIYNRKNPFYLFFDYEENERVLKQLSLFPIIPSIRYDFKF